MKKQTIHPVQAHLLRGAFYLLLLLPVCAIPFALAQRNATKQRVAERQRMLTFAERVAYQRAIEDVYWRHRIWPKENPDPKPSLDAVLSQALSFRNPAGAPPPCAPPPAGMVGWWPGDGNADDIQGSNNGTLEGGA